MIGDEHPQVITIIMSVLEDTAARAVSAVANGNAHRVMRQVTISWYNPVPCPNSKTLCKNIFWLGHFRRTCRRRDALQPKIMNRTKLDLETEIGGLKELDEDLAVEIQNGMFD